MIALFFALAACSGFDKDANLAPEDAGADATGAIPPGTLRVDVHPAADAAGLLPQSFVLAPGTYEDVEVSHALNPTSFISGTLLAATVQGWNSAAASSTGPLDAVVSASRGTLLQGGVAATNEAGEINLALPANQPYSLAILPNIATASPFVYLQNQVLPELVNGVGGLDLSQVIDAGCPVYGRVVDASGAGLARASLHLRRADVEVQSATFTSDTNGWFVARVEPGYDYVLETEGVAAAGAAIPVVSVPFSVEAGDVSGVQVEVDVGERSTFQLDFDVFDADGQPVPNPTVRATSRALATGTLVWKDGGQTRGHVTLNLLPGDWTIEVWPSNADHDVDQASLTPTTFPIDALAGDVNYGAVALVSPATLHGVITTPEGDPAAGVTVTAVELGFGEYTFSAVTGQDGAYSLAVPRTPVRLQAIPAAAADGAFTHEIVDLEGKGERTEADLELSAGTPLEGIATLDGTPVPFAFVEIYDHAENVLLARTLTDTDGHYLVNIELPVAEEQSDTGEADTGEADTGGNDTGDTADTADTADTGPV